MYTTIDRQLRQLLDSIDDRELIIAELIRIRYFRPDEDTIGKQKNSRSEFLDINTKRPMAANDGSRGLAYLSTASYVGRLIFCVRYGYRSFPIAMAAMDLNERDDEK